MSGKTEKLHRKMARIIYGGTKVTYVNKETDAQAVVDHVKQLKIRWNGLNNAARKVVSAAIHSEIARNKEMIAQAAKLNREASYGNPLAEETPHRKF